MFMLAITHVLLRRPVLHRASSGPWHAFPHPFPPLFLLLSLYVLILSSVSSRLLPSPLSPMSLCIHSFPLVLFPPCIHSLTPTHPPATPFLLFCTHIHPSSFLDFTHFLLFLPPFPVTTLFPSAHSFQPCSKSSKPLTPFSQHTFTHPFARPSYWITPPLPSLLPCSPLLIHSSLFRSRVSLSLVSLSLPCRFSPVGSPLDIRNQRNASAVALSCLFFLVVHCLIFRWDFLFTSH